MWCPVGDGGSAFYARRFAYETAMHRADAALAATLTEAGPDAHWLLDLTGDVIAWRRAGEPATAEIRRPVTELLLAIYRRRPVTGLDISGDAKLVDFWLERVAFG